MRSTPSPERGRFVLPRDLSAAAATAATLILAFFVLGWLTSGLITGVWSPSEQAAKVTHGAVALAAPSERERAPRAAAPVRRTVRTSRPAAPQAVTRPRAKAAPRRAATKRTRRAAPSSTSPVVATHVATPVAAPVPAPVATVAETVSTTPVQTVKATSERSETSMETVKTTSERSQTSKVAVQVAERSWTPRGRGRSWRPVSARPTPTPTPTPAPAPAPSRSDEHEGWDHQGDWDGRGWDHGDDDRRWGR